jgi:hypothetical protein
MSLFHCTGNGLFGPFGDYVWATDKAQARLKFYRTYRLTPFSVTLERRAK